MASQFDESDFVDADYQSAKNPYATASAATATVIATHPMSRPPTHEELGAKVSDTQQKLAELKRAQEELERERAALEEARRRRIEFQTGREEMLQHLTRGIGVLEETEFAARRDAEQMGKTLAELREALKKVQSIQEESWTQENWNVELTRALTTVENARMEWNGARLKWQILSGAQTSAAESKRTSGDVVSPLESRSFAQLCKLGLALTWPVAVTGLIAVIVIVLLLRR